jgi:hypothetical protein
MTRLVAVLRTHYGIWAAPLSALITILVAAGVQRLVGVFLYAIVLATTSVAVVSLAVFATMFVKREGRLDSWLQAASVSLIGALFAFSFLSTVPLNVDRSFSVWSINQIYKQDLNRAGIPVDLLKKELEAYFSAESGEIDRRLTEQTSVGNIVVTEDSRVVLTDQGIRQRNLFFGISEFFGLNPKYAR